MPAVLGLNTLLVHKNEARYLSEVIHKAQLANYIEESAIQIAVSIRNPLARGNIVNELQFSGKMSKEKMPGFHVFAALGLFKLPRVPPQGSAAARHR